METQNIKDVLSEIAYQIDIVAKNGEYSTVYLNRKMDKTITEKIMIELPTNGYLTNLHNINTIEVKWA